MNRYSGCITGKEAGYSLVESTVAFSLLFAVLIPLSGLVIKISSQSLGAARHEAFMVAQKFMEQALGSSAFLEKTESFEYHQWMVNRYVSRDQGLVFIEVSVTRKRNHPITVVLKTARLKRQTNNEWRN